MATGSEQEVPVMSPNFDCWCRNSSINWQAASRFRFHLDTAVNLKYGLYCDPIQFVTRLIVPLD
jgi:hypothetical protein